METADVLKEKLDLRSCDSGMVERKGKDTYKWWEDARWEKKGDP